MGKSYRHFKLNLKILEFTEEVISLIPWIIKVNYLFNCKSEVQKCRHLYSKV